MLTKFKESIHYEPTEGKLYWKPRKYGTNRVGLEVGNVNNGYRVFIFNQKRYYCHRVIWLFEHGKWPDVIDHKDGNRLNNKLSNLSNGTQRDNLANRREHRAGHLIGTSYHKTRKYWVSQITINGKHKELGRFKTQKLAHDRYLQEIEKWKT